MRSRPRAIYPIPVNHSPPVRVDVMRRKPGFKGSGKGKGPEWGFELVRAATAPAGGKSGGVLLIVVIVAVLLALLGAFSGGHHGCAKE